MTTIENESRTMVRDPISVSSFFVDENNHSDLPWRPVRSGSLAVRVMLGRQVHGGSFRTLPILTQFACRLKSIVFTNDERLNPRSNAQTCVATAHPLPQTARSNLVEPVPLVLGFRLVLDAKLRHDGA